MSRKRNDLAARSVRITELYGKDLRWTNAERGLRLTPEAVARLTSEGYTMATVRTGMWRTRRISLLRLEQKQH